MTWDWGVFLIGVATPFAAVVIALLSHWGWHLFGDSRHSEHYCRYCSAAGIPTAGEKKRTPFQMWLIEQRHYRFTRRRPDHQAAWQADFDSLDILDQPWPTMARNQPLWGVPERSATVPGLLDRWGEMTDEEIDDGRETLAALRKVAAR